MSERTTKPMRRIYRVTKRTLENDSDSDMNKKSISTGVITGVLVVIIPAILGYVFSYADGLRKEELVLRNSQIEKLYGPLYTLTQSSDSTWKYFAGTKWRNGSENYFDDNNRPTPEQVERWRLWMRTVFQPMNMQMQKVIAENTHLIVGESIPKVFQDIITHTEAYKAVIAEWSDRDQQNATMYTSENKNVAQSFKFPDKIVVCVKEIYFMLRKRQRDLQGSIFYNILNEDISSPATCEVQRRT